MGDQQEIFQLSVAIAKAKTELIEVSNKLCEEKKASKERINGITKRLADAAEQSLEDEDEEDEERRQLKEQQIFLKNKLEALELEYDTNVQEKHELEDDFMDLQIARQEVMTERTTLMGEMNRLKDEIAKCQSDNNRLKQEYRQLLHDVEDKRYVLQKWQNERDQ